MKKKTPIQKLIEQYQQMREEGDNDMRTVIYYAEEMRREEKEQLTQAVYRGEEGESFYGSAGDLEGFVAARQDAEEWFERTYESNE
jgi:16S rRNA G1207 methylase RsmC